MSWLGIKNTEESEDERTLKILKLSIDQCTMDLKILSTHDLSDSERFKKIEEYNNILSGLYENLNVFFRWYLYSLDFLFIILHFEHIS